MQMLDTRTAIQSIANIMAMYPIKSLSKLTLIKLSSYSEDDFSLDERN